MKRLLVILLVSLAVPAAALASSSDKTDGTLNVTNGRGVIVVAGRGTVLGNVRSGTVTIVDLTPNDKSVPWVSENYDSSTTDPASGATTYRGSAMRFRILGGAYRVAITGRGVDIVAVGQGTVRFPLTAWPTDGRFSLDGAPFQDMSTLVPFSGTFGGQTSAGA